jgi:hypothetical protein
MKANAWHRAIASAVLAFAFPGAARSAASADVPVSSDPRPLRVLFVGNSYLYTHVMPDVVASVAAARGIEIVPGMLAEPNFAIEDHLATGRYEAMLAEGWHWVVLQQGPSSLPENQVNLRVHSARATELAWAHGARVALMSAWPALPNASTWLNAELSYRNAAVANRICVLPVATAWRLARTQQPGIRLFQPDELHPERAGTLLAAETILRGLMDHPEYAEPLNLSPWILAGIWQPAVANAVVLDDIARQALDVEPIRCRGRKDSTDGKVAASREVSGAGTDARH